MAKPTVSDLAYRTVAGIVGSPVDLATMVMRPFGYKTPDENVVGGSEWIGKQLERAGLVSSARAPIQEFLASVAVPTPSGIGKGLAMGAPALAGIFVGKGSRTWDALNAQKAKDLEKAGVDARTIWKETGTWRGPDGKWRQEIDDSVSRPGQTLYSRGEATDLKAGDSTVVRRQKALLHPPLSAAYPDTKNIGVNIKKNREGGSYNVDRDAINVGASRENLAANRSTMLHELQHAIQQRESFATGGSPNTMILALEKLANQKRQQAQEMFRLASANDPLDPLRLVKPGARQKGLQLEKEAREIDEKALQAYRSEQAKFDLYQRLAGEAEARAVQSRMDMTPAQRRATFPEESYDVPLNQLIISED